MWEREILKVFERMYLKIDSEEERKLEKNRGSEGGNYVSVCEREIELEKIWEIDLER